MYDNSYDNYYHININIRGTGTGGSWDPPYIISLDPHCSGEYLQNNLIIFNKLDKM